MKARDIHLLGPALLAAAGAAFLWHTATAQTPSTRIDDLVAAYAREHAVPVTLSNGRLVGAAAEWFRTEAAKAQFFFIGEEHDVREIPLLAGALWRELEPLGYAHVAIEAGPWLGNRLDRFARFGDREALAQFRTATWPRLPNNTVPPISDEDLRFYEVVGSVSGRHRTDEGPVIWGLDNEYRAAPLLQRLTELSRAPTPRGVLEPLLARVQSAEASGDYDTTKFREEINQLTHLLAAKPGTEAFQLLDALKWRILEPDERAGRNVKKELFIREYQAAKARGEHAPRVMLRFGGYHGERGLMRDFGGSTLANYVAELAVAEHSQMLNVLFNNCQGTTPGTFPRPCTGEEKEALRPFELAAVAPWTLFDLRGLRQPIRQARLSALQSHPEGWEYWNLVMRYDALVLLRQSEKSHIQAPPPIERRRP
jgi:hypothetical protein